MATEKTLIETRAQGEVARLRTITLRLGGLLGWPPSEVRCLAEALTGRPWRCCGERELRAVLEEYGALAEAVEAKARRRARREGRLARERRDADRD